MSLKKLNEEIESLLEAKEVSNYGNNAIDFDNIGCGIQVETGTSEDGFLTIHLEGYSANNGKNIEFKSKFPVGYGLSKEERIKVNSDFRRVKQQLKETLLQAANDFDKQIAEIMRLYGFTNK